MHHKPRIFSFNDGDIAVDLELNIQLTVKLILGVFWVLESYL